MVQIIEKTPIRLAMKLGVSFALTTPLPRVVVRNSVKSSITDASVVFAGIISTRCMYRGGLKKCTPQNLCFRLSGKTSAKLFMLKPDVLVAKIALSLT